MSSGGGAVPTTVRVLGLAGSLRRESFNKAALRAAQEILPPGVELEVFDIAALPLYNQDLDASFPEPARLLKERVRAADCVLFSTPEYNYSIPGVLKNAIDWGSRPYGDSCWQGKPVAVMSASAGLFGGARAQYHLRQTFVFLDMHPINKPEVMLGEFHKRCNEKGELTDPKSRELIQRLLQALADWTRLLARGRA